MFQTSDTRIDKLHSSQVQDVRENFDYLISGQPVVHQALGGRKLKNKNVGRVYDSLNSSTIPWNLSQLGTSSGASPRTTGRKNNVK